MQFLTKTFHFCAAHQCGHEDWSDKKNIDTFGADTQVHGHNYTLEVTVKGEINPDTGFVVDLTHLKDIVNTNIIAKLDHSQIEKEIDWFKGKQRSSENILLWAWEEIAPRMEQGILHRLRLVETHSIFTDYYGPEQ